MLAAILYDRPKDRGAQGKLVSCRQRLHHSYNPKASGTIPSQHKTKMSIELAQNAMMQAARNVVKGMDNLKMHESPLPLSALRW